MISPELYRFHQEYFSGSDVPVDSPQVFFALVAELARLKRKKGAE